jgi:site-specific DNA-methyltransferase (adenine-specific)/adenine-specific DNA-methyltransferase
MYWRVAETKFKELDRDKRIYWGPKGDNMPRLKRFLSEVKDGIVPQTLWTHSEVGHTQEAKKELLAVLDFESSDDVFITPKPTRIIERVLQIASNPGDLVLDSFAGSGTTGHAVLKLNAANPDQPPRRFIMVEVEDKVATEVTRERVCRVAEGYTNAKGEAVAGLGGGFRFCELGEPLFDESGHIRETVKFGELARHVYFSETREPLPRERVPNTPLLGVCRGVAVYLLFNGILGDKTSNGGNVLTRKVLAALQPFAGPKVIYCAGCLIGAERLAEEGITIRQTPYEIRVS